MGCCIGKPPFLTAMVRNPGGPFHSAENRRRSFLADEGGWALLSPKIGRPTRRSPQDGPVFPRGKLVFPIMATIQRRKTLTALVGGVRVGSDAPVVVQSMTNTDTADVPSTVQQGARLSRARSELVRV